MDGSQGKIGLALMTDNTTVPAAPSITLRARQYADPMPQYTETEDTVATGTRFGTQKFIQGVTAGNKTVQATATLRDLPLLLTALLAAPVAGVITPRPGPFGVLMPVQPVAVWQAHPLADSLFPAAQVGGVTINIPTRDNATVDVTLNTARVETPGSLPVFPAIAATGILQFLQFFVTIDGKKVAPESGSIVIEQGMEAEDGAQGQDAAKNMFVIGYSLNGPLRARVTFQLSESGAGVDTLTLRGLMDKARPGANGLRTPVAIEAGFKIGTDTIKFNIPVANLLADQVPNGLGRVVVGFTAEASSVGVAPLTVNVPTA